MPGDQNPNVLTNQEVESMQHVYVEDGNERKWFHYENRSPGESWTAYHDVNTTDLNAVRKVDGGCSPDGK